MAKHDARKRERERKKTTWDEIKLESYNLIECKKEKTKHYCLKSEIENALHQLIVLSIYKEPILYTSNLVKTFWAILFLLCRYSKVYMNDEHQVDCTLGAITPRLVAYRIDSKKTKEHH